MANMHCLGMWKLAAHNREHSLEQNEKEHPCRKLGERESLGIQEEGILHVPSGLEAWEERERVRSSNELMMGSWNAE